MTVAELIERVLRESHAVFDDDVEDLAKQIAEAVEEHQSDPDNMYHCPGCYAH